MENKVLVSFLKENDCFELDINQPDLSGLIHLILKKHIVVTADNISVTCDDEDDFDCELFKDMLIEVHDEFSAEIDTFYKNIKIDISTYYNDEKLSEQIISELLKEENKEKYDF